MYSETTSLPHTHISSSVDTFIASLQKNKQTSLELLNKIWYSIVGDGMRGMSQVVRYVSGVVVVVVSNSTLLSILATHQYDAVYKKFKGLLNDTEFKKIAFRLK